MAEKEKDKKRKRESGKYDKPNKKVAIAAPGKAQVTFVDENGLHPIAVSAPGLSTPEFVFKTYSKALSSRNASNGTPKPATHDLLLHSSAHPKLDYTARTSPTTSHQTHYVAIFDPESKQLHITTAYNATLRSTLRSETEELHQAEHHRTFAQQREQLGLEFGTKKAKKAIASKTENAITPRKDGKRGRNDVQDAVFSGMKDEDLPSKQDEQDASLAAKPIPRPNLQAEAVDEVYPLSTLIPESDMRLLPAKDWQDAIAANEEVNFSYRFPAFRLRKDGNKDDVLKLKALRYMLLLLEFHAALSPAKGGAGKKVPKKEILQKKLSDWPEALIDSVRRRFAADNGSELPKWNLDKLYSHMAALSLYIDGWVTEMSNLKEDLRMENKALGQYYLELGCKVAAPSEKERQLYGLQKAQAKATRVARLKLPLEFPKVSRGRRR